DHLTELIEEGIEFGAGFAGAFRIDESGMAGGLAQTKQGFEHVDFGLRQAIGFDAFQQRIAIVLAELIVEFSLQRFELAVDRLLCLGRKLACNLFLGATKDEWTQSVRQQTARVLVGAAAGDTSEFEDAGDAQHAGVEELKEGPKLAKMVL